MLQTIKIFLASSAELKADREKFEQFIGRKNKTLHKNGRFLELVIWEDFIDAMSRTRLQDEYNKAIAECDIFVMLFHTKVGPFTREEFEAAFGQFQQTGKPWVYTFFKNVPANIDRKQRKDIQSVWDFQERLEELGHFQTEYDSSADLENKFTRQLELRDPFAETGPATPPAQSKRARLNYLRDLFTACNRLPLSAIADDSDPIKSAQLTLSQVYVDLNTTTRVDKQGRPVSAEAMRSKTAHGDDDDEKTRPQTVFEAAAQQTHLVILGDPGSGKSSFVNHLLAGLAAAHLQQDEIAAGMLQAWPHRDLLPVRALVRDLAVTLDQSQPDTWPTEGEEKRQRRLAGLVRDHLAAELDALAAGDYADDVWQAVRDGRCLVVFDGLDEATAARRRLLRQVIEAFCAEHAQNRVLVTCRIRSYVGDTELGAAENVTLAPFDEKQVERFIERWYDALAQVRRLTPERSAAKKKDLRVAVATMDPTLVQNPLLLTTMAYIHANNVELPRQRVRLYKKASDLLLRRWQEEKEGKVGLLEALGLQNEKTMYNALWELAFFAQKAERGQQAADIPEKDALDILRGNFGDLEHPWAAAEKFLDFTDHTAGLLAGRGGAQTRVYAFPHRTFQEYFAGCYLAKRVDFKRQLRELLPEGDYWRLSAQLGIEELLHNDNNDRPAIDVAYFLCPESEPRHDDEAAWRGILWAGVFAQEIGRSAIAQDTHGGGPAFLERLVARLVTVLEKGLLPVLERADAGLVLGLLGDPRPGVCTLPPAWIALPGGRFTMGDSVDGPPHDVVLSPFALSKYPITNAQFSFFIAAGGYDERQWWSEAGWREREKENWQQPRLWDAAQFNLPNQPVVGVSWYEAEAFCRWLSAELKLKKGQAIRLPTEAEWEYAARGSSGRRYAWGDAKLTVERANYFDTGLHRTSAVGCFPRGDTPDGMCDMIGNVWEWCADWYGGKYYDACKKQGVVENPAGPASGEYRVLRCGSWLDNPSDLRCAVRSRHNPSVRLDDFGFRCAQDVR